MPIQKLETNNVLKEWLDTINEIIDVNAKLEANISDKVDIVDGKGLSTEDFTTALKTKLAGIEEGANKYILPTATDTITGGVILSDSFSSTSSVSDGIAATPSAVKEAYDLANAALPKDGGEISGDLIVKGTLSANIVGNSETATKLASPAKIALSGDASGVVEFDGSDCVLEVNVLDDSHSHIISDIDNLEVALNSKASLSSPTFTGSPKAPTASNSTNSKQIATTAFVHNVVDEKIAAADAMIFKGTIGIGGTVTELPAEHSTGWTYKVITAGTYAGVKCNIGDMIVCLNDGSVASNDDWTVIEGNIDGAVTGPTSSVSGQIAVFDGATGKVIKDSGFTIASSVPSDAKFTDTIYTGSDGITLNGTNFTNSGVRSISSGSTNGTIKVDTNGVENEVNVAGLGSAAYTESINYAPNSHISVSANESTLGHVYLTDSVESEFNSDGNYAATPYAVKRAYDLAKAALPKDGGVVSGDLTVNGIIVANSISGNAESATEAEKLASPRKIAFGGDVSGYGLFDGSEDIIISLEVSDDSHSHIISDIDNLEIALNSKASLSSPTFTGIPIAPTATFGTNTTQIATTAFVNSTVEELVNSAVDGVVRGPESAVVGQIAVFNDVNGDSIKDSGFTIAKSVPANAKFTDTTYTVGTESYSGTTKLYTSTGSNTDGTITQKVITDTFLTNQDFEDYKNSEEVVEASDVSWNTTSVISKDSVITIPDGVLYPYGMNAIIVSVDGIVLSKGTHYEEVGSQVGDFSDKVKFLFEVEYDSTINVWVSPQAKVYGSWDFIQSAVNTTFENVEQCRQYAESFDISSKADINSPIFTGTPTAPTATAGTNTTQIATTEFVNTTINNVLSSSIFANVIILTGNSIDLSLGSCFTKTITDNITFSITGCPAGKSAIFTLVLTNGGSKNVTWDSSVKWADDEVPELTSSGTDILTFITVDGGMTWYGSPSIINAL